MDAILVEIYSTILPSAPYVIAAYTLLLAVLFVFAFAILRGVHRAEAQMQLIEEELEERSKAARQPPQVQPPAPHRKDHPYEL